MKKTFATIFMMIFIMTISACALSGKNGNEGTPGTDSGSDTEKSETAGDDNEQATSNGQKTPENDWWSQFFTPTPEPPVQTQETAVDRTPKATSTPTPRPDSIYSVLGIPDNREFSTYVFSITGDPADLTDRPDGLFYGENYLLRGIESEKPVHVDVWAPDGEHILSLESGVRIFGAYSRQSYLKSLKLFARESYDENNKNFKYDFFETPRVDEPDKDVKKYKKLVLRNSGNDYQFAWIRDELCQTLAKDAGFTDYEAVAPAVYYLNGEYRGLYWLHETYCDNYFKNKYGDEGKNGDFVVLEGTETAKSLEDDDELTVSAAQEYNTVYDSFIGLDMTDDAVYERLNAFMDVENYIRYYAYNIYICNRDWPCNNYKCYRYYAGSGENAEIGTPYDGRWRFLLHDMDFSTGLYGNKETVASYDKLGEVLSPTITDEDGNEVENERYSALFAALMERKECRNLFVDYSLELANGALSKENINAVLDEMNAERATEIDYFYSYLDVLRTTGDTDIWCWRMHFDQYTDQIRTFAKERANYSRAYIERAFGMDLHK